MLKSKDPATYSTSTYVHNSSDAVTYSISLISSPDVFPNVKFRWSGLNFYQLIPQKVTVLFLMKQFWYVLSFEILRCDVGNRGRCGVYDVTGLLQVTVLVFSAVDINGVQYIPYPRDSVLSKKALLTPSVELMLDWRDVLLKHAHIFSTPEAWHHMTSLASRQQVIKDELTCLISHVGRALENVFWFSAELWLLQMVFFL